MPKGTALTGEEKEQIKAYKTLNHPASAITEKNGRFKTVVLNHLRDPSRYGTDLRSAQPFLLTPADKLLLLRQARKGNVSSNGIRMNMNLPV